MKYIYPTFFLYFLLSFESYSQNSLPDSVGNLKNSKWVVQYDGRYSFINKNPTHFYGFLVGEIFQRKNLFSIGIYTNISPYKPYYQEQEIFDVALNTTVQEKSNFHINYLSFAYERTYFHRKRFYFNLPVEIGIGYGKAYLLQTSPISRVEKIIYSKYIPIQIGNEVEYKILDWLSARAQIGYRYSILNKVINKNFNVNYNGFYYSFGLRVYTFKLINKFILKKKTP